MLPIIALLILLLVAFFAVRPSFDDYKVDKKIEKYRKEMNRK